MSAAEFARVERTEVSPGFGLKARRWHLPWYVIACVIVLGLIAGARLVQMYSIALPKCTFRMVTGHPCLSCGVTRSFGALSHLDIASALHFNPLAAIIAMAIIGRCLIWVAMKIAGREWTFRISDARLSNAMRVACVGAALVNWVYLVSHGI